MAKMRMICVAVVLVLFSSYLAWGQALSPLEELGKRLFFDENLSTPPGQSCATCHAPEAGFTGPSSEINATQVAYPGAVATRAGNRKPPTAAYGGDSPVLFYDEVEGLFIGGMFWDGRATGWTLGDPLAEQAQGPFLNPLEQNNANAKFVCSKVAKSDYADLFEQVWGPGSLDPVKDVAGVYERIARSISAYEQSNEVNPFTSKYDYYLAGQVSLTAQEALGLELFEGKAMCSACHISEVGAGGEPPLFTDFTYDNLGIPRNPDLAFYDMPPKWNPDGEDFVDPGLGGFLMGVPAYQSLVAENLGKHKVPTLRNVDKRPYPGFVKGYGHNGYFKSLEEITHFYNTRDVEAWPPPEVPVNVNTSELGDLGLTPAEEAAIVAFMKTLTDGYVPPTNAMRGFADDFDPVVRVDGITIHPNPFNPATSISFSLDAPTHVTVQVYDVSGRLVQTLLDEVRPAGMNAITWDGNNARGESMSSGVYFVRLKGGSDTQIRKAVLMK